MKRFFKIAVVVITCFAVLCCSTLSAFAVNYEVNSEGFQYYEDENSISYFDEFVPFHIQPYSTMRTRAVVPGTEIEYTIEYTIEELIGGAAAGGSAVGTVATITTASTGTIVLGCFLVGCGLMVLCEPEYVETTLNDVWYHLSGEYQAALNDMYNNPTYVLDAELIEAINDALSKVSYTSDGVDWKSALTLDLDNLTGSATAWASDYSVVITGTAEELASAELEYTSLPTDYSWISLDPNGTILYKYSPQGRWNDTTGVQTTATNQSTYTGNITIRNTLTGTELSWYFNDADGDKELASYQNRYEKYVMEPIWVDDGIKQGISIPVAIKKSTESYIPFIHQNVLNISAQQLPGRFPIVMTGTGSLIDGKLITDVAFDVDSGKWNYTYYDPNKSYSSSKKTILLPFEPFHWTLSQSSPSDLGVITSPLETETTDDKGKITTNPNPQIDEDKDGLTIPAPDKSTTIDEDTGIQKETVTLPDGAGDGTGNDDSNTTPFNPDNPDDDDDKKWSKPFAIFQLKHLFDWLPESYSKRFDNQIMIIGSAVLTLFLWTVIKKFRS